MRLAPAVLLALLAPIAAQGAEKPIPQDIARTEATSRASLEWCRKTCGGAYDKVGKKDPRWDKLAAETLELAARKESNQVEPAVTDDEIHLAAKRAVDAGCDDPMILYHYARTSRSYYPGLEEYTRRLRVASETMSTSGYPLVRRAYARLMFVDVDSQRKDLTPEGRKDAERQLDAVLDLLPKSLAEDPRGEFLDFAWYDISKTIIAILKGLVGDEKAAFDRVDARLVQNKGPEALRWKVQGNFYVEWAWSARGTDYASKVSDAQFRQFQTRLAEARKALERAWKLDQVGIVIPNIMLRVELGDGGGNRAAMEKWFERAMQANGNNKTACLVKLNWLDPKWYGDEQGNDMIAFGKACAATKNWKSGILLLGVSPHYRRYQMMEPADWKEYLKTPAVWADFVAVYPEHLKHWPDDHVLRSQYAMCCYESGHFREAHEQFQILGDKLAPWRSEPRYPLDVMKQARDEVAKSIEAPKK